MSSYQIKKTPGDTEWFRHDRFGMFIHFGLYSLPARWEWMQSYEFTKKEDYQKYFDHFDPDLFDAKEWARQAKAAGMKYAVLTTKHHEGFCLFDSKYTDFKSTNTPFGRDLVREFVDAFRAEGIRIGFYYSLLDWHHDDYPIDRVHPRRMDEDAEQQDKGRDMAKYAQYMRDQITELLTNYGKIDILWLDFSYTRPTFEEKYYKPWMQFDGLRGKEQWESDKLIALIRSLQPEIIINNRADVKQDLWTPEQFQPTEWVRDGEDNELVPWEACHTFSGSWGYFRDEMTWKSDKMLIDMLVNTVSVGGNLIMNVGPTGRGYFDHRAQAALGAYADWMKVNSRSIYGCTMAEPEFKAPEGAKLTQSEDGKRLYIHLQTYPFGKIAMDGLNGKVEYAQFLHDASVIEFKESYTVMDNGVNKEMTDKTFFSLPTVAPNVISPVIEVFLK